MTLKTLIVHDRRAAAFLLVRDVHLLRTLSGDRTLYKFDDSDATASRALHEWNNRAAMVEARAYVRAFTQVRKMA